jgi:hypothetical protein
LQQVTQKGNFPYIIDIVDSWIAVPKPPSKDRYVYMVLEYCDEGTLEDKIENNEVFSEE